MPRIVNVTEKDINFVLKKTRPSYATYTYTYSMIAEAISSALSCPKDAFYFFQVRNLYNDGTRQYSFKYRPMENLDYFYPSFATVSRKDNQLKPFEVILYGVPGRISAHA